MVASLADAFPQTSLIYTPCIPAGEPNYIGDVSDCDTTFYPRNFTGCLVTELFRSNDYRTDPWLPAFNETGQLMPGTSIPAKFLKQ